MARAPFGIRTMPGILDAVPWWATHRSAPLTPWRCRARNIVRSRAADWRDPPPRARHQKPPARAAPGGFFMPERLRGAAASIGVRPRSTPMRLIAHPPEKRAEAKLLGETTLLSCAEIGA